MGFVFTTGFIFLVLYGAAVGLLWALNRRWWRLSPRLFTRWALGLTTRLPWLRERLRTLKRRLQGRAR